MAARQRTKLPVLAVAGALALTAAPALRSQEPPAAGAVEAAAPHRPPVQAPAGDEGQPVFRAQSDLVVLHVNVFDGRSDAVPGLPRDAFTVLEDGRPQAITFFSGADVPVAVGLVVDNSTSMIARRPMVVAGAEAFVTSSHPEDQLFTLVFNEHVRRGLPDTLPFTNNLTILRASLLRFATGGLTALHDAVMDGLDHLEEASHQKHVLVVLADGDDNASRHSRDDMLRRAAASSAIIYTISLADVAANRGNPGVLRALAEATGGVAYAPRSEAQVVDEFATIAGNIRRGYSIGYVPDNPRADGRYRRVQVTVRTAERTRLSVRARDGYLASR